jgi:hypothetical protein
VPVAGLQSRGHSLVGGHLVGLEGAQANDRNPLAGVQLRVGLALDLRRINFVNSMTNGGKSLDIPMTSPTQ